MRLERALRGQKMNFINLTEEEKIELKRHLFANLGTAGRKGFVPLGLEKLKDAVKEVARGTVMSSWEKYMVKERVMDYAEHSVRWRNDVYAEKGGWFLRNAFTTALIFIFVFSSVLVFPFNVKVVHAKATYLDDVLGDVKVVRKTSVIKGADNVVLEEGDTVITELGGFATIKFLDESLSRMGEGTSIEVKKLRREPLKPVVTNVELFLKKGRIWSRVLGLFEESTFVISTSVVAAEAGRKAAFDLVSDDEKTEVSVFDNVVEVSQKNDNSKSKVLIAGYKAEAKDMILDNVTIQKLPRNDLLHTEDEWYASNLMSDEAYKNEVVEDKERNINISSDGSAINSEVVYLGDGSVFEDEEIEALRQKFLDSYKLLVNAEAQFVRGARSLGISGLKKFKNAVAQILGQMDEINKRDPLYAGMLRALMQEKVSLQLNDFASFLPGDRLYHAKEALQEVEIMLAETEMAKITVRLKQAEGMLFEIQELLNEGKYNLASTLLKRYQNHTNGLSLTFSEQNVKDLNEKFVSLLERQFDQIKVLTAIEKSIIYKDLDDYHERVKLVLADVLRKFAIAMESNEAVGSEDLLLKVEDLINTYNEEEDSEDDLTPSGEENIQSGIPTDGAVSFITPSGETVAGELGILVIVAEEATAEVQSE